MTSTPGDDLAPISKGRDWIFVLDFSGSMEGKFHSLVEGVGRGLARLNPDDRFRIILDEILAAWNDGDLGRSCEGPGLILVSELFHRARRRADEVDLAAAADFIEMGVFGEEPISGMNCLNVADFGCAHDLTG